MIVNDMRHQQPITDHTLAALPDLLYRQIMTTYRLYKRLPTELAGQCWLNESRRNCSGRFRRRRGRKKRSVSSSASGERKRGIRIG